MMKIVWLSQYNVSILQPELKLNREAHQHTSSWIHNLSESLALHKEIELHIITHSQLVDETQSVKKYGIFFHVIKYTLPFTSKGFPGYFPYDKLTGYYSFQGRARKVINELRPDLIHVHGTEGGYFSAASGTGIPFIVSMQGIISEYVKIEPSFAGYLQSRYEKRAVSKARHFGCRTDFDNAFVRKLNKTAIIHDLPEAMNMVFYKHQWKRPADQSILFVGLVKRPKGIEDLIHAMPRLVEAFPN
ncbi:MAG TPA: glycosyltransferase, partial [Flavisolibacter sp.]|nr:glycosyltransferase [Flavisolibacter sp.]